MPRASFLRALRALRILFLHCCRHHVVSLSRFDEEFDALTSFLEEANNHKPGA